MSLRLAGQLSKSRFLQDSFVIHISIGMHAPVHQYTNAILYAYLSLEGCYLRNINHPNSNNGRMGNPNTVGQSSANTGGRSSVLWIKICFQMVLPSPQMELSALLNSGTIQDIWLIKTVCLLLSWYGIITLEKLAI